jgi:hypothetical protein
MRNSTKPTWQDSQNLRSYLPKNRIPTVWAPEKRLSGVPDIRSDPPVSTSSPAAADPPETSPSPSPDLWNKQKGKQEEEIEKEEERKRNKEGGRGKNFENF